MYTDVNNRFAAAFEFDALFVVTVVDVVVVVVVVAVVLIVVLVESIKFNWLAAFIPLMNINKFSVTFVFL